jgi:hypothetical protein
VYVQNKKHSSFEKIALPAVFELVDSQVHAVDVVNTLVLLVLRKQQLVLKDREERHKRTDSVC